MDAVIDERRENFPQPLAKSISIGWAKSRLAGEPQLWWGIVSGMYRAHRDDLSSPAKHHFGVITADEGTGACALGHEDLNFRAPRSWPAKRGVTLSFAWLLETKPSNKARSKRLCAVEMCLIPGSVCALAHSTLGWPEETPELAHFYPTSV